MHILTQHNISANMNIREIGSHNKLNWNVIKQANPQNKLPKGSWLIVQGSTDRLIWPDEMSHYEINHENENIIYQS